MRRSVDGLPAGRRWLPWVLVVLATGVGAGLGGASLILLLHVVQHLAYGYHQGDFAHGSSRASPVRRLVAMAVGGAVVGCGWWALRRWGPPLVSVEAALRRGTGAGGARRPQVLASTLDACLQIMGVGFGASLGREGAPRQVGAALAGWSAQRAGLSAVQQRTLVACGAGAGLAAVYNVPLGGAVFALEVLLQSAALADVVPALLTSAVATVVAWPVVGDHPTYSVSTAMSVSRQLLVWAVLVGPLAGVLGVGFTRLERGARRVVPRGWRLPVATTGAFGAVGAVAMAFPQVLGNGRAPAEAALAGATAVSSAAVLLLLRPLTTAACLRAGAVGGLLTPAVALGALLGVLTGRGWELLWPTGGAPALGTYAVVAAAAVLATTQRAPLTALVLMVEFTGTGHVLLVPLLLAVAGSSATAAALGDGPRCLRSDLRA